MSSSIVSKIVKKELKSDVNVSFEDLKIQITKDFQLAGISFLPDETKDLQDLISWTLAACLHLIEKDFQTYMNLLYRIDVPAEKFMQMNEESSEYDSNEIAAMILIKREIQKIRLRKKYDNTN